MRIDTVRYYFIAARYDDRAASDVCGDWYESGARGSVQTGIYGGGGGGGSGSLAAACLRGLGISVLRAQTYARAEGGEAAAVGCRCSASGWSSGGVDSAGLDLGAGGRVALPICLYHHSGSGTLAHCILCLGSGCSSIGFFQTHSV